jgi:hypothetical protein
MPSVTYTQCHLCSVSFTKPFCAECHYGQFNYADCLFSECPYAECPYTECPYAQCRSAVKMQRNRIIVHTTLCFKTIQIGQVKENGITKRYVKVPLFLPLQVSLSMTLSYPYPHFYC